MPVYLYKNIQCVSAGIIFYRNNSFLLLDRTKYLEDPGGKSQADDETIEMTAAREAAEELNAKIQENDIKHETYDKQLQSSQNYILKLLDNAICFPHKRNKYALFVCELPEACGNPDFGKKELHSKYEIIRDVKWVSLNELLQMPIKSIHPRIRHFIKLFK